MTDALNPARYKGTKWEAIDIIEAHGLDHFRASALALILHHSNEESVENIRDAVWYLRRLMERQANILTVASTIPADPDRAMLMDGRAIANDFGIFDDQLEKALQYLIPDPTVFIPIGDLTDDIRHVINELENWLGANKRQCRSRRPEQLPVTAR